MAVDSSSTLTKFADGVVVTKEICNKWFGGLYGSSEGDSLSPTDPRVVGHAHDGLHSDGHAQKINLVSHVTGQLINANLADGAVRSRNILGFTSQASAIPEYYLDGATTYYNLDLSDIRADIAALTAADIAYDNSASGLTAADVQDAVDELTALPKGYVSGFEMSYLDAKGVTVTAGECRDDTDTVNISRGTSLTLGLASAGAGGLDTGVEAANTWYYIYVISKADGTVNLLASVSSSSPTMPSGYLYKRYIGPIKNDAASDVVKFWQFGNGVDREYFFDDDLTNQEVATGVSSGTYAAITCTSWIPAGVREVHFSVRGSGGAGVTGWYFRPSGSSGDRIFNVSTTASRSDARMVVGTDRNIEYKRAGGTDVLDLDVKGFTYHI
jgi:hypothetical protein